MKGVMKVARGEGNVEIRDVAEPHAIPGHAVLEVVGAGVCGTDIHIYHDEYSFDPPVVLGHETAGTVVEVGDGVKRVKVGDRVTTETFFYTCGKCIYCRTGSPNLCKDRKSIGSHVNGAMTNFVLVPEQNLHILPENVSLYDAVITEPLACCVNGIVLKGDVKPGDVVMISGPGAMGQYSAQLAKACGATTIMVGITGDESRLSLAKKLGADYVIDAAKEDLSGLIESLTEGRGADVVIEAAGAAASVNQCIAQVKKSGSLLQMGLSGKTATISMDEIVYKELKVSGSFAHVPAAWPRALRLLSEGKVKSGPIVTKTYPITQWEQAFNAFNARTECKIVVTPV